MFVNEYDFFRMIRLIERLRKDGRRERRNGSRRRKMHRRRADSVQLPAGNETNYFYVSIYLSEVKLARLAIRRFFNLFSLAAELAQSASVCAARLRAAVVFGVMATHRNGSD